MGVAAGSSWITPLARLVGLRGHQLGQFSVPATSRFRLDGRSAPFSLLRGSGTLRFLALLLQPGCDAARQWIQACGTFCRHGARQLISRDLLLDALGRGTVSGIPGDQPAGPFPPCLARPLPGSSSGAGLRLRRHARNARAAACYSYRFFFKFRVSQCPTLGHWLTHGWGAECPTWGTFWVGHWLTHPLFCFRAEFKIQIQYV